MDNNETMRRVRWALSLDDAAAARAMTVGGVATSGERAAAWRLRDGERGAEPCPDEALSALLAGIVRERRGPDPRGEAVAPGGGARRMDNNAVLKALRIALGLRGEDIVEIVREGTAAGGPRAVPAPTLSVAEVGSLLRRPGARNYRRCGDQVLRRFLNGLGARLRHDAHGDPGAAARPGATHVAGGAEADGPGDATDAVGAGR